MFWCTSVIFSFRNVVREEAFFGLYKIPITVTDFCLQQVCTSTLVVFHFESDRLSVRSITLDQRLVTQQIPPQIWSITVYCFIPKEISNLKPYDRIERCIRSYDTVVRRNNRIGKILLWKVKKIMFHLEHWYWFILILRTNILASRSYR